MAGRAGCRAANERIAQSRPPSFAEATGDARLSGRRTALCLRYHWILAGPGGMAPPKRHSVTNPSEPLVERIHAEPKRPWPARLNHVEAVMLKNMAASTCFPFSAPQRA